MNTKSLKLLAIIVLTLAVIIVVLAIALKPKSVTLLNNPAKDNVLFPELTDSGQELYYFDSHQSMIKKWDLVNNKVEQWIQLPFANVQGISYSPDKNLAWIHWSNPLNESETRVWLADLKQKTLIKQAGENIDAGSVWSPNGQKIAAVYYESIDNYYYLSVFSYDGQNRRNLVKLGSNSLDFIWLDDNTIVFHTIPSEDSAVPVKLATISSQSERELFSILNPGFMKRMSDNSFLLGSDQNLKIYNIANQSLNDLGIKITATRTAQKPNSQAIYSLSRLDSASIQLHKIDTTLLAQENLAKYWFKQNFDHLMLDGRKFLYFISENNSLYRIELEKGWQ